VVTLGNFAELFGSCHRFAHTLITLAPYFCIQMLEPYACSSNGNAFSVAYEYMWHCQPRAMPKNVQLYILCK